MNYKLKTTRDELYKKGFRYNKLLSDDQTDFFSYRFPVHRYKNVPTLECELNVSLQTGNILIHVYKAGTNENYIPFYNSEYGKYTIIDEINAVITKQLVKFGAKKKWVKWLSRLNVCSASIAH